MTEYLKAPEVTRERLYLDAVQEVMSKSSKVLVDVEGGNNMIYLPLDKLSQPRPKAMDSSIMSESSIREIADEVVNMLRRDQAAARSTTREAR